MNHPFRVIASVSGGKDSAAMCLWLKEQGIEHERVFCDTGWEHEDTYRHIREVLEPAFGPISWLRSEVSLTADQLDLAQRVESIMGVDYSAMVRWVVKKMMFPSRMIRFCTEELKVDPIKQHLAPMANAAPWAIVNAVGIRAGESFARSQLPEWEASNLGTKREPMRAWTWRPIRDWTEQDVIDIHKRHGLPPNPLYVRGGSRVGCWPCIFARKAEVAMFGQDDRRVAAIEMLDRELSSRAMDRAIDRSATPFPDGLDADDFEREEQLRNPLHWRNQRTFFGTGEKWRGWDSYDIKTTIEWARTERGGHQLGLFNPLDEHALDGCMRWGMCETDPKAVSRVKAGDAPFGGSVNVTTAEMQRDAAHVAFFGAAVKS